MNFLLLLFPGQGIPPGLHVRMNFETGKREAKLMDGDSDPKFKYWKEGDREGKPGKPVCIDALFFF